MPGVGEKSWHLLGMQPLLFKKQGQLHRIPQGAARVGGHQIGHEVLLFPHAFGELIKPFLKPFIGLNRRFAHVPQHMRGTVLGRHLELAADVMGHQLPEKAFVRVGHQIIVPDPRPDEDLFYPGQGPQTAEQVKVIAVVRFHGRTGGGCQALLVFAQAPGELPFAGRMAEIGRRTAHIVDIPFEARQAVKASASRTTESSLRQVIWPPLMKGQGTEVAPADAAPVVSDGESDLLDPRHASHRKGGRVDVPHIRQLVHPSNSSVDRGGMGGFWTSIRSP